MQERENISKFRDEQSDIELVAMEMGKMYADSYADYLEVSEGRTVGKQEREDMIRSHVEHQLSQYHHDRANKELEQYHVWWDAITHEHVVALKQALKDATNEEDIQRFLNDNKIFLVQHLGSGHGRYVLPKPKLGAQLIPDFLVAEMSSIGLEWFGIELESPSTNAKIFTSSGQQSHQLTHAVQQIVEWREWLSINKAYARNPDSESGLGLIGIDENLPATILIGRRKREFPSSFNAYRRQMKHRQNIEIHTYDWLVERAADRVQTLHKYGKSEPREK